jgi:hypothetical protein
MRCLASFSYSSNIVEEGGFSDVHIENSRSLKAKVKQKWKSPKLSFSGE